MPRHSRPNCELDEDESLRSLPGVSGSVAGPAPLVSVIVPTYNSGALIGDALEGLARQTLPAGQLEVLVVDDGSTDETWSRLLGWTGLPGLRTFHQPHSGTPSAGRNRGLLHARGVYVFFHDADDYLGEDALRRLVAVAEGEGSDVVVGQVHRVGQPPPSRSGGRSVLDADLLNDGVWRSLGPHKLFRRALVDHLGLVFCEDMVQGEDQVFVASCLFAASKVSVLRDYDYYYRRHRDDGRNLSRQRQTLQNKFLTCSRMTALVVAHTTPGERRDKFLRRVLVGTLAPGLAKPFMTAQPAERDAFLSALKDQVLPHLTSRHLAWAKQPARARLAVASSGQAEDLARLNEVLRLPPRYLVEEGVLARDLGGALNSLLPAKLRQVDALPVLVHRIVTVRRVRSGFRLRVQLAEPPVPINRVDVLASLRRGGDVQVTVAACRTASGQVDLLIAPHELRAAARNVGARRKVADAAADQIWDFTLQAHADGATVSSARLSWNDSAVLPDAMSEPRWWMRHRRHLHARLVTTTSNVSLLIPPPQKRQRRWSTIHSKVRVAAEEVAQSR